MGRNRKSEQIDTILKNWDRMGFPEMSKGQRVSVYNHMLAMSQEELARLVNDKKKPIFMVNIARGLLSKHAFENQEKLVDRLDGKTNKMEVTGKDGKDLIPNIHVEVIDRREQVDVNEDTDD